MEYILKIIRCAAYSLLTMCIGHILYKLGLLDPIKTNLIPNISIITVDIIIAIITVILTIIYLCVDQPNSIFLIIKRYSEYFYIIIGALEIVMLFKSSKLDFLCQFLPLIEATVLYYLVNLESSKYYDLNIIEKNNKALYVEKPIVGEEYLTIPQKKSFNELVKLIDERKSEDSFNIGLIGPWGCGKSSIINSLIKDLSDSKRDNRYFILKVGVLELNNISNIVSYIQGYIEDLFSRYEISIINKARLLSSLSLVLESKTSVKFGFGYESKNTFLDLEKEQMVLEKQIQRLLKRSKRKNIILIVEDADRMENKDKIFKLMAEFSGIEGFIGIICLDKSNDILIRPQYIQQEECTDSVNKPVGDENLYHDIDKFIHIRVRVDSDSKIYKNEVLTREVLGQYKDWFRKENAYIQLFQKKEDQSLFSMLGSNTVVNISLDRNEYDVLTDIFFAILSHKTQKNLGEYFDELVYLFTLNTIEIRKYFGKRLQKDGKLKNGKEDHGFFGFYYMYINHEFSEHFGMDYLNRIENISNECFSKLLIISKALVEFADDLFMDESTAAELWFKYINKDNQNYKYSPDNEIAESQVGPYLELVFDDDEIKQLSKQISNKNYTLAYNLVKEGIARSLNLLSFSMVLQDFIFYVRDVANNYRCLKMQLREADLLQLNYLDYLMGKWVPRKDIHKYFKDLKKREPIVNELNYSIPSIRSVVDTILFANYIQPHIDSIQTDELNDCRAYFINGKYKDYIVVSKRNKSLEENIYIDIENLKIIEFEQADEQLVEQRNNMVWGTSKF